MKDDASQMSGLLTTFCKTNINVTPTKKGNRKLNYIFWIVSLQATDQFQYEEDFSEALGQER